jgi:hypothetical protein
MTVADVVIAYVLLCAAFIVSVIVTAIGGVIWRWWSECLNGIAEDYP